MKFLFTAVALLGLNFFVHAQAYEGAIKVKKVEEPAIIMVYDYPEEIVENAFKAKLTDKRLKGSKSKGFLVYSNATLPEISDSKLDYSLKFDESGKRGKEKTTVFLLMKGDNSLSKDASQMARNAKAFLENMAPDVKRANIIAQIKDQEGVLVKEEKKLKNLKDDQSDLEKKLQQNKDDQESQEKIIKSQQDILADLKAKQN